MDKKQIKILVWLGVAVFLSAWWVDTVYGSPLVFQFHSPSFSGVGTSSHYLTIENLEKSRRQAIIDKEERDQRLLDNELRNTAIEIFRRNLESLFYSNLASQIIDNIFGEDGDKQNDGRTIIGDYLIIWTSTDKNDDADGVSVIIRDATTNEVLWKYDFPYQESE